MSAYPWHFLFNCSSEQADHLSEMHSQLVEVRSELGRLKEERARLADAAMSARHWRDEADAGQQAIVQLREAEHMCAKLKQRLEAAQYYKVCGLSVTIRFCA